MTLQLFSIYVGSEKVKTPEEVTTYTVVAPTIEAAIAAAKQADDVAPAANDPAFDVDRFKLLDRGRKLEARVVLCAEVVAGDYRLLVVP